MKIYIKIIVVIFLLSSCKTNNYLKYHRIVNEAEYSFFNEDYQTASELFAKAFKKVPVPFEIDIYYYSKALWEIGEYERSISLLDTLGLSEAALTKTGFYNGIDSITQQRLIEIATKRLEFIKKQYIENPIYLAFDSIDKKDQDARHLCTEIVESHPNDTLKIKIAVKELAIVDSINLTVIDSLFEIHGFIGGVYTPYKPLIMHLSMFHQLEWVYHNPKIFKKAIKKGRLLPCYYAGAYDKAMLFYGDTIVRYGQYTSKLNGISPEEVFEAANNIGVSPYFAEGVRFPNTKGRQPTKHFYYEYYAAQKNRFKCFGWRRFFVKSRS